jgi:hypothetical protein
MSPFSTFSIDNDRTIRLNSADGNPARTRAILLLLPVAVASSALFQFESGFPESLAGIVRAIGLVALFSASALIVGDAWTRSLSLEAPSHERLIAGILFLSIWPLLIGSFGLLYPALLAAPTLILPILGYRRLAALMREEAGIVRNHLKADGPVESFLLVVIFAASAWGLLSVLVPPIGLDAPSYHLGLPMQYLLNHSVVPPDDMGYYLYWQQFEMAILPLVALDESGMTANAAGFPVFAALLMAVGLLAREHGGKRAGLIAVAAVAASPLVLLLLSYTKNDLLAAAAFLVGVRRIVRSTSDRANLIAGGLLLGGALAVKPTAIFAVGPALLFAMVAHRRSIRTLAALIPSAALLPSYWAVRNLVWTRATVLPPNIELNPGDGGMFIDHIRHLGSTFMRFHAEYIDGPIGAAPLVLLVAAIALSRNRLAGVRTIFALGFLLWMLFGNGQSRFLIPVILFGAAAGARRVAESGPIMAAALICLSLQGLGATVRLHQLYSPFLLVHTGSIGSDEFVRHWIGSYPLQKAAAQRLPEDARIASVGEPRLFYLRRRALWDSYWETSRVLEVAHATHDPRHLAAALTGAGFTHLLYDGSNFDAAVAGGGTRPPPCAADTPALESMLRDSSLSRPVLLDPLIHRLGIHALVRQ